MTKKAIYALILCLAAVVLLAPTAWAAPGDELVLGTQSDDVRFLQEKLQQGGFYPPGEPSGHFGLETLAAVNQFEKANKLSPDGKVTEEDWQILAPELFKTVDKNISLTYYTQSQWAEKSLKENASNIDYSAKFSHYVTPEGNLVGQVPLAAMDISRRNDVQTLLVVHNMEGPYAMDGKMLNGLLNSADKRKKLVQNINQLVEQYGFAGVNIDFEGILPQDRQVYNQLLAELKQSLGSKGYLLTVAVPAKTVDNPKNSWTGAYDYQTIGQLADYVVLMTYDENGAWSGPGPVASLPWVENVVKYATSVMPSNKILLGVPAYGNEWVGTNAHNMKWSRTLIWKNINELTNYGPIQWHNGYSVPYITYYKNNLLYEAWFENQYSLNLKLNLAKKYQLAGTALWKLGLEDNTFWQTINNAKG